MVYTLSLKHLSFKQNLASIEEMINDQMATYAILKHCNEIPDYIWQNTIDILKENIDIISYKKLKFLVGFFI